MDMITQQSLHDELLERLKKMIIAGEFLPGDKIPERQLCEQFGVSRTPLREALKVLAAEGLVQLAPNRGAVVATLNAEEIEECVPISEAIEDLSGQLACAHITDAEIAEINGLYARMVAEHGKGNRAGCVAANRLIHERIVSAARNPLLATIYDTVFFRLGWSRVMSQLSEGAIAKVVEDHRDIVQALSARDGKRLSELLRRYLAHIFEARRGENRQARH
jgi:DNA-binding GntR family transcriptional regulator